MGRSDGFRAFGRHGTCIATCREAACGRRPTPDAQDVSVGLLGREPGGRCQAAGQAMASRVQHPED
eukprot:6198883-Pleurochrysis_carterae.AAC.1